MASFQAEIVGEGMLAFIHTHVKNHLQYRSDLLSVPGIQEPILTAKELLSDIFSSFAVATRHPYLNT